MTPVDRVDRIEQETHQTGAKIVATLVGGVLLANALIALALWEQRIYSDLLALFATILLAVPLVHHAVRDLRSGRTQMNELAALGVLAAFATQEYLTAGTIAFFMVISVLIVQRSALGARKSIESLIRLTPTRARKVTDEGETEIEAERLVPGDVVRVRPGDNIPGDGVIRRGRSTVNQANVTGESLPAEKEEGDEVFGGTINLTGVLDIEITKSGRDTTLGRVRELILQAERSRIPILQLIDRYAAWYTPLILMLAGLVLFFTRDVHAAIAMLVIACPFAIILSTPSAIVAALSAAARLGILIKNVSDLEVARNLTAIVFDKTGTLTTGELSVTRMQPVEGLDGADLLRAAAAVEQNSRHPVAQAVVAVAKRAKLKLSEATAFEEVQGQGVRGTVNGEPVLVGRRSWMLEQGEDLSRLDASSAEGLSLLFVCRGGTLLGWIGLEDRTRPDAAAAVDALRELGVKHLVMVTGDRESVARRVAAEMRCTEVRAEVLPAEKLELVNDLKARGHIVAVVGDGVNDAPALAAGHISIAMGAAGSDVAIHSASIALMNNNLDRIPFLLRLSRRAIRVVRQNLGFSVVFILLMLGLSAFGLIHPIAAVLLHAASSILVVFNSARLVREGEELETAAAEAGSREPSAPAPVPVPA